MLAFRMTSSRAVVHAVVIVLACALVFANALGNGLHLDDWYRVADNPGIRAGVPWWRHFVDPSTMSTLPRIEQYRPLLPLTLSWNQALTGDSLVGYHAGNLLCHAAASVLVWFLVRELLLRASARARPERIALFTALLFAVHPVSGILVNYVCARDQLLMQAFLLGSLLAYVRMRRLGATWRRWGTTLVLLALAMLGKTDAAVAPALVLLYEALFGAGRQGRWRAALGFALPPAAVVAAFFAWTRWGLGFSDVANVTTGVSLEYAWLQARLHLLRYLPQFFWPFPIRMLPHVEPAGGLLDARSLLGALFVLATLVLAWRARLRAPLLSFAIVAYWVLLAPTSSLFAFHQPAVDYRPYPGSPFLFLALALAAGRWLPPRLALALGCAWVLGAAAASVCRNRIWRTGETLWSHSVAWGGDATAHLNYAMSIADRRDPRVRAHLEEALRRNPAHALARTNLGLDRVASGDVEGGLADCRRAVLLEPGWAQLHHWLAEALAAVGRDAEAWTARAEAVRLEPRHLLYRTRAARTAQRLGRHDLALPHAEAAAGLAPADPDVLFLRGFSRQALGDLRGAAADYERLLEQRPDHVQVRFNLAHARMGLRQHREAIAGFEAVLARQPGYREAHLHLATCLDAVGEADAAARHRRAFEAAR
jgi:Flp pilus assembly protein TadD